MIDTDFIKKLDTCNISDFRNLVYLSKNDEWVNAGGELYRLKIVSRIETVERQEGSATYFDKIEHPLSSKNEFAFKLLIGKEAQIVSVFSVSSSNNSIDISKHDKLPDLKISPCFYDFSRLYIETKNHHLELRVQIENYDFHFLKMFSDVTDEDSKSDLIFDYANSRNEAMIASFKSEIWQAAASGDHLRLSILLNKKPSIDLYSTYKGKTLIEAMFNAKPEYDIPFEAQKSDYKKTLALLKGFDFHKKISLESNLTFLELCNQYQQNQNHLKFYQPYNPVHNELLLELRHLFPEDISPESTFTDHLKISCSIL